MIVGRARVFQDQAVVDAAFTRAAAVDAFDPMSGDLAKHLVILVSGWIEQSVYELARACCRGQAAGGPLLSFALSHLDRTYNPWSDHVRELIARFDEKWASDYDTLMTQQRKDALHSVMGLRTLIAHVTGSPNSGPPVVGVR